MASKQGPKQVLGIGRLAVLATTSTRAPDKKRPKIDSSKFYRRPPDARMGARWVDGFLGNGESDTHTHAAW